MAEPQTETPVVNGWRLYAHPLFIDQLTSLTITVEGLARKDPEGYRQKNAAKRLRAIFELMMNRIPSDPSNAEYRLGGTLGDTHKRWCRARFFQQYRLFYRFNAQQKVIVFGWVNDETTKRAYESKTDAYRVFAKMLANGNPPDDWDSLLAAAQLAERELAGIVTPLRSVSMN